MPDYSKARRLADLMSADSSEVPAGRRTLAARAVAYSKIQDVSATNLILGRDSAGAGTIEEISPTALRTMLGIEPGSTADQTNAEIRTAVEAASDSNVFTDADHSKLNAIEASATADQTNAEIRAAVEAASDSNVFTDADHSKLNAIEASATADQTNAEIETAYDAQVAVATQGEAEAGSSTDVKRFTPQRIGQAIAALASGGLSLQATPKTANFTAVAGQQYIVDTSSSAFTMTFPASPSVGDTVGVIDYAGTFHTNNLTLGRNSVNVLRAAADGVINTQNWSTNWMYVHATPGWLPVG